MEKHKLLEMLPWQLTAVNLGWITKINKKTETKITNKLIILKKNCKHIKIVRKFIKMFKKNGK